MLTKLHMMCMQASATEVQQAQQRLQQAQVAANAGIVLALFSCPMSLDLLRLFCCVHASRHGSMSVHSTAA